MISPKRRVDGELREKILTESPPGVVERDRGPVKVLRSEETNEPVAQILLLHQDEHRHDDDDERGGEGIQDRCEYGPGEIQRRGRRGLDLHKLRLGRNSRIRFGRSRRGIGCSAHLLVEARRECFQAADRFPLDRRELLLDRRGIGWDLGGEPSDLHADQSADRQDSPEADQNGQQDGRHMGNSDAPQQADDRRQHEGQQDRQGDGDQNFTCEIEGRHDHDEHGQAEQSADAGRFGRCNRGGGARLLGRIAHRWTCRYGPMKHGVEAATSHPWNGSGRHVLSRSHRLEGRLPLG